MSLSYPPADAIVRKGEQITARALVDLMRQGSCVWIENVEVDGVTDLRSVEITSAIHAIGCVFHGEVDATDARFSRSVRMHDCVFESGLILNHARICGPLDLAGSTVRPSADTDIIDFSHLTVDGRCGLERLKVEAEDPSRNLVLDLHDLRCGAGLILCGTKMAGGLCGTNAHIEGVLDLGSVKIGEAKWERTFIGGKIDFDQVTVGSQINLSGSRLSRITLDQCVVRGTIFCAFDKESRLPIELTAPGEAALWLHGAKIDGNIEIRGATLKGAINVSNARVRGNLVIEGYQSGHHLVPTEIGTAGKDQESLRLVGTTVEGSVEIHDVQFHGDFNASNASVGMLSINKGSRNSLKRLKVAVPSRWPIKLTSLTFKELLLPAYDGERIESTAPADQMRARESAKDFQELLDLTDFDESTYAAFEAWLRQQGKDGVADDVFLHMRRRELGLPGRSRWRKGRDRFFLLTTGYGVRARRLFIIWLLLLGLTWVIFFVGKNPVQNEKAENPPSWGLFDSIWITLRVQVPLIEVAARDEWKPAPRPIELMNRNWYLQYDSYACIVTMLNWLIVPVMLAGLAGLLKRRP